jgi:hypothetical protein
MVRGIALEELDAYRVIKLASPACLLAGMYTNTSQRTREGNLFAYNSKRFRIFAPGDVVDITGDIDVSGAGIRAGDNVAFPF